MFSRFGESHKMLSDNGTEFMNKLFALVAATLGVKQVFISPFYPEAMDTKVHKSLMMCKQKHVSSEIAWDEDIHIACDT